MTLVLIHGYNLNSKDWRKIVIGEEGFLDGRLVIGMATAVNHNADVIMIGSGGSSKDGISEAQWTKREICDSLINYCLISRCGDTLEEYDWEKRVVLDETSKNTREELENAYAYMQRNNMHTIYFVSSPAHLPRCTREACDIFRPRGILERWNVFGVPSETSWAPPENVAVFEPPHLLGNGTDWSFLRDIWRASDHEGLANAISGVISKWLHV